MCTVYVRTYVYMYACMYVCMHVCIQAYVMYAGPSFVKKSGGGSRAGASVGVSVA